MEIPSRLSLLLLPTLALMLGWFASLHNVHSHQVPACLLQTPPPLHYFRAPLTLSPWQSFSGVIISGCLSIIKKDYSLYSHVEECSFSSSVEALHHN